MKKISQLLIGKGRIGHILKVVSGIISAFVIVGGSAWATVQLLPSYSPVLVHQPVQVASTPESTPKSTATQPVTPPQSTTKQTTAPTQPIVVSQPVAVSQPTPGTSVQQLEPTPTQTTAPSTPTGTTTTGGTSSDPAPATGGYYSSNWSGYAAMSGKFTAVSGTWVIPSVSGNGAGESGDASWVGIGGINSSDLIQAGTDNTVNADGSVSSIVFYEMLPNPAMEVTSLKVSAGDTITASVSQLATGEWNITVSDTTTGQSYTNIVSYSSTYSSAEWIEEDPSYSGGSLVPFDRFSHVVFSGGSTTMDGVSSTIASSNAQPITLVDGSNNPLATPSVLINDDGFWVVRN